MSEKLLACTYDIWISGTKQGMEKKQCIRSISVQETVEGADSATIVIADPELLFIEDSIFVEENKIKIEMGWAGSTYRCSFDGYIAAIDINFASDGIPVVTVTCMDNTHVMNRKEKNETYKDMTSAEVVKKICANYGFACVVESGYSFKKQETITQSGQTDIAFITKLAGEETAPFTARLVGNTFYYVKLGKLQTPSMTLVYREHPHTIITFQPKVNKETRQEEIQKSSVDTKKKAVSTTKSSGTSKSGSSSSSGSKKSTSSNYNPNTSKANKTTSSSKSSGSSKSSTTTSNTGNASKASSTSSSSGKLKYNPQTRKWEKV